jgi:hypothetical protein
MEVFLPKMVYPIPEEEPEEEIRAAPVADRINETGVPAAGSTEPPPEEITDLPLMDF